MKPLLAVMAAAAVLLAACDRPSQPRTSPSPASSPASSQIAQPNHSLPPLLLRSDRATFIAFFRWNGKEG